MARPPELCYTAHMGEYADLEVEREIRETGARMAREYEQARRAQLGGAKAKRKRKRRKRLAQPLQAAPGKV